MSEFTESQIKRMKARLRAAERLADAVESDFAQGAEPVTMAALRDYRKASVNKEVPDDAVEAAKEAIILERNRDPGWSSPEDEAYEALIAAAPIIKQQERETIREAIEAKSRPLITPSDLQFMRGIESALEALDEAAR